MAYLMPRLREIWAMTHHDSFCPNDVFQSYMGGQFLVSKHRIYRNPIGLYKLLKSMLLAPASHFIHNDVNAIKDPSLRSSKIATELNNNAKCVGTPPLVSRSLGHQPNAARSYFSYQLERSWVIMWDCMVRLSAS